MVRFCTKLWKFRKNRLQIITYLSLIIPKYKKAYETKRNEKTMSDELEKIEQQSSKKYDVLENTGIIMSDRFQRFQILDFLWQAKRSATERNNGTENSPHISNSLNIEEIKVRTHLQVLEDHRFISISNRTRGGWIVEITGKGTIYVEDFFIELEQYFRNSDNLKIKNHIQKTDQEHDVVVKHTLHMQIAMTVQEVFKFGNNLLSKF